ncbi:uncharacterized protein LOC128883240 isoform X2 [Hylaeus volcanicus]|uniref:uncharacterized protein LOC128883240 isoform X2 n=1 Tax=Hylaeus volcanicus TaxID=313075 RepID=UPI0023B86B82|nr:uncharacterized protein LOC128883240 isoform X2 [Hylaeus volcanicus]
MLWYWIFKEKQDVSQLKELETGIEKYMIFNSSPKKNMHSFTELPFSSKRRDICLGCLYFSPKAVYQPECLGCHLILLQEKIQKCALNDSYKSFNESPSLEFAKKQKKKDTFFLYSFLNKFRYRTQELLLRTKSLIELHVLNDFHNFPRCFHQRIQFLPLRSFEILKKCVNTHKKEKKLKS